jgi:hypothetical protein
MLEGRWITAGETTVGVVQRLMSPYGDILANTALGSSLDL